MRKRIYNTEEERREANRKAQEKWLAKTKSDPALHEAYKEKHRIYGIEYYLKKKQDAAQRSCQSPALSAVFEARIAAVEKENSEIREDIKELCEENREMRKAIEELRLAAMKIKREAK
jgi:regulator of replication initiation timing